MSRHVEMPIPADVPLSRHEDFIRHYSAITRNSGRLMMFACDQKIEHLNKDFYGSGIHADALHPHHLFAIASRGTIGAVAMHLGLIARYGSAYAHLNYIAKLNGKTDLMSTQQRDPLSTPLWKVRDVVALQKSGINICGVGFTLYLGSEFEQEMLASAAEIIFDAHQHGLVTILWVYPRGHVITDDLDPQLVAGATGLANSLGADFVKIKPPRALTDLAVAVAAAGNTKVICSGGISRPPEQFLQELYDQITKGNVSGSATGRNIFQKSLNDAVAFTKAIAAIVFDNRDAQAAIKVYNDNK